MKEEEIVDWTSDSLMAPTIGMRRLGAFLPPLWIEKKKTQLVTNYSNINMISQQFCDMAKDTIWETRYLIFDA